MKVRDLNESVNRMKYLMGYKEGSLMTEGINYITEGTKINDFRKLEKMITDAGWKFEREEIPHPGATYSNLTMKKNEIVIKDLGNGKGDDHKLQLTYDGFRSDDDANSPTVATVGKVEDWFDEDKFEMDHDESKFRKHFKFSSAK